MATTSSQHVVKVRRRRHPQYADMWQYRALCSCGWKGRIRTESRVAAQEDEWVHLHGRKQ